MDSVDYNARGSTTQNGQEPAALPEKCFRSSWVNAAVNCGVIGVAMFLIMCLILGWKTWAYASGCGVFVFGFYFIRYLVRTPKEIRIGENGFTLIKRKGEKTFLPWERIEKVVAGGTCEDLYMLESWDGSIQFSDDGYSVIQWEDLTNELKRIAQARGIPFEKRDYRKKKSAANLMSFGKGKRNSEE